MISRRTLLQLTGLLPFTGCGHWPNSKTFKETKFYPISSDLKQKITGDNPHIAHEVLWNKSIFPVEVTQRVPLVIVGGGIAGLVAAYKLRDFNPLIIEQARQFGGNAKGETWKGISYAIGSAYISNPEEGTEVFTLLRELGLIKLGTEKTQDDPIELKGKFVSDFWNSENHVTNKTQLKKIKEFMSDLYNERKGLRYPNIPSNKSRDLAYLKELDSRSLKEFLEDVIGERLDPTIESLIQQYCWSSFNAGIEEVSAASGLNFFAADESSLVFPGGNSQIADALLKSLQNETGDYHLRSNCLVADVRVEKNEVLITYFDDKKNVITVAAKAAIMACPKFICSKIIHGLEAERLKAIKQIKYRSYIVANVLLNNVALKNKFYDLYLIEDGITKDSDKQRVCDVISANFSSPSNTDSVLTLYHPMPYEGGRAEIYSDTAFQKKTELILDQVKTKILPFLNIPQSAIEDVRFTKWGHPLPVSSKGIFKEEIPQIVQQPFKEQVFFINQDNWVTPAAEVSIYEGLHWSKKVRKLLEL